jgi:hypothetical protein
MATVQRVRYAANPKRRYRIARKNAAKRSHRRRRTTGNPGPKLRRYSVKTLKKELRRRGVKTNPTGSKTRRRYSRPRRSSNPVLIELGAINPFGRRKKRVARTRRKNRVYRRRRHNPRAAAPRRRRRYTAHRTHRRRRHMTMANPVHHRRRRYHRRHSNPYHRRRRNMRHYRRHRNPALFGHRSGKDLLIMTGGVLVGVAATKYIPTILPSSITSLGGGSQWMGVLITGAGAFAAGWAARKFGGEVFGDAVMLGGLAQVGSQILTIIAPPSLTNALALSGMGDILAGSFVVPQNPIKAGMPMPSLPVAKTPPSGVGAFHGAWGNRR